MVKPPTNYIESNAILYAQSGDDDLLLECLRRLFPNELRNLWKAANRLGNYVEKVYLEKTGESIHDHQR